MKSLGVYLNFDGTCREALNFYKECLGGEIGYMQTFGESPMPVSEESKDRIMHADFKCDEIYFMASDTMPGMSAGTAGPITLNLAFTDLQEQEQAFNKMAEGGKIEMELQNTFWKAKFGIITDKFGIKWMFNCPIE